MGIYVYPNQKTERNRASGNKMPPLSLIEGDNFFHGTHFVNSYMRNICLFNRNSRLFSVSWFALWGQPGHSKNSSIISHTFYLWLDAPWLYLCHCCQQPVYFGVVRTMSLIWQKKPVGTYFTLLWRFCPQNTFVFSFIFYSVGKWFIHLKDIELTMTDQYALYMYTSALDVT